MILGVFIGWVIITVFWVAIGIAILRSDEDGIDTVSKSNYLFTWIALVIAMITKCIDKMV